MTDKHWFLVLLDPRSAIGQMYAAEDSNNDGITVNAGCPVLRCTDIHMDGPLLFAVRKPSKGPSRQELYIPYSAVVGIFQADRHDDEPEKRFGFQLR